MHMEGGRGEKYIDIGYNLICCPHSYVFIGRGAHRVPAANGPGLNSQHYAVLALVGVLGVHEAERRAAACASGCDRVPA